MYPSVQIPRKIIRVIRVICGYVFEFFGRTGERDEGAGRDVNETHLFSIGAPSRDHR